MDVASDLARRIRDRRDELNLTQQEAAAILGVTARTVQAWEAGKKDVVPRPRHRRALERFFSESVEVAA